VAVAALMIWLLTVAAGVYLLLTSTRSDDTAPAPAEPVPVPAVAPSASPEAAAKPARDRDRFDPPSLARAKSAPMPGLRAFAEFAHPALAVTGFAFWLIYILSRDQIFAAIGFGILLGAICAGLSWAVSNARAAKREQLAAQDPATGSLAAQDPAAGNPAAEDSAQGESSAAASGPRNSGFPALLFSHRVLLVHGVGAACTLLLAALIIARV
jgi:hypothetical protein